jgi:hypothetical protein
MDLVMLNKMAALKAENKALREALQKIAAREQECDCGLADVALESLARILLWGAQVEDEK